ncbi:MAG TPA: helix-turn-helix transcriptional regulator [Actinocrinis sp.]
METSTSGMPAGPDPRGRRMRIAIVSPEILEHVRQAFASRGLRVQIDRLPSLELTVAPGPGAAPAAALGDALGGLVGPVRRGRPAAAARYRLSVVGLLENGPPPSNPEIGARRRRAPGRANAGVLPPAQPRASSGTLSAREAEVMECISHGMQNPEIAERLQLSLKTVKNHVNHIFAKLEARSRVEAVLIWQGAADSAPSDPTQPDRLVATL